MATEHAIAPGITCPLGSLTDKNLYQNLDERLEKLGKKLNRFIKSVEKGHRSEK